jgi:hypothetical protein
VRLDLDSPPAPPTSFLGRRYGGGDSDMRLESMSPEERRAILSLWVWQEEALPQGEPQFFRKMIGWQGDQRRRWTPLAGRSFLAKVDSVPLAVVVAHYENDWSSLLNFLLAKQMIVVDAIGLSPSLPSQTRALVDLGVMQEMRALADYHSMRVVFCPNLKEAARREGKKRPS